VYEFIMCIHCIRGPLFDSEDFKAKVIEHRLAMSRHIGGGPTGWSVIISHLLQQSCSELLSTDIEMFSKRLSSIIQSWFDPAWEIAIKSLDTSPPVPLKAEVEKYYCSLVDLWCDKMKNRMLDFVMYSIRDYNPAAFQQRLRNMPVSSMTFSTGASHLFSSIMEEISPGNPVNSSSSSLLESSLCSAVKGENPSAFDDDVYDLQLLEEDRPEDPVVLEKLRKICFIQVQFGTERIRETFRFIFECMFKRPLCTKLNRKLVDWSSELPDIIKERLKKDNVILQEIEKHIHLISQMLSGPVITA